MSPTDPGEDERPPSSHELWLAVKDRYRAFLEAVGDVQRKVAEGSIPPGEWPYADEVADRMGISPDDVMAIVAAWDHFVDVGLVEFGADRSTEASTDLEA